MTGAPSLTITFELEAPIRLSWDCAHEQDAARLRDWIDAHPEYAEVIHRAHLLAERAGLWKTIDELARRLDEAACLTEDFEVLAEIGDAKAALDKLRGDAA